MPSAVPTPVAAALGLVPAVLSGVRRLPGRAVQLPVLAVGSALSGMDAARREYDDLAARGERLLARLRGTSFDDLEDRVEDALQGTPLARPYDAVEDALEDAGEAVAGTVSQLTSPRKAAKKAAKAPEKAATKAAATVQEQPGAEQAKGAPTPQATQPDSTRIDTAATPGVLETVEQAAAGSSSQTVPEHDELPLPDYDHMTLGSLRGRLRSLDVDQLVALRSYEKAHADRLPVVTMLDNRIAKLASAPADEQPGGVPSDRPAPGQATTSSGSPVTPSTSGPKIHPPSQGVPTNPAQPRSTG